MNDDAALYSGRADAEAYPQDSTFTLVWLANTCLVAAVHISEEIDLSWVRLAPPRLAISLQHRRIPWTQSGLGQGQNIRKIDYRELLDENLGAHINMTSTSFHFDLNNSMGALLVGCYFAVSWVI